MTEYQIIVCEELGTTELHFKQLSRFHPTTSGHAFLLVYINLFILEEARTIDGWEGIREQIRLEDHHRGEAQNDPGESKTTLEGLTPYDMAILKVGAPHNDYLLY